MTKEVLISISGLQVSPESETDTVEMIAPGEYYFRNNKHYLVYNEVEEGQTEPSTKNVIKFSNDYMEVIKKGPMSVHMVFEKDKKNISYYNTPFGSLLIGIEAKDFSYQEKEDEMVVEVDYNLEINSEHVAKSHIKILVKSKDNKKDTFSKRVLLF